MRAAAGDYPGRARGLCEGGADLGTHATGTPCVRSSLAIVVVPLALPEVNVLYGNALSATLFLPDKAARWPRASKRTRVTTTTASTTWRGGATGSSSTASRRSGTSADPVRDRFVGSGWVDRFAAASAGLGGKGRKPRQSSPVRPRNERLPSAARLTTTGAMSTRVVGHASRLCPVGG